MHSLSKTQKLENLQEQRDQLKSKIDKLQKLLDSIDRKIEKVQKQSDKPIQAKAGGRAAEFLAAAGR